MGETVELSDYRKSGARARSVMFCGASFMDESGAWQSPGLRFNFPRLISAEEVADVIAQAREAGGVWGDGGTFIPWPCAAVRVEWVD